MNWINVDDRKPVEYVDILIYSEVVDGEDGSRRAYLNAHGHYISREVFSTQYKPTHWMKIDPPK